MRHPVECIHPTKSEGRHFSILGDIKLDEAHITSKTGVAQWDAGHLFVDVFQVDKESIVLYSDSYLFHASIPTSKRSPRVGLGDPARFGPETPAGRAVDLDVLHWPVEFLNKADRNRLAVAVPVTIVEV